MLFKEVAHDSQCFFGTEEKDGNDADIIVVAPLGSPRGLWRQ